MAAVRAAPVGPIYIYRGLSTPRRWLPIRISFPVDRLFIHAVSWGRASGRAAHNGATSPMMNLSLFRVRMFTCSVISAFALATTYGLVDFIMSFYL